MNLLLCTQAVDKDDRVLGFFHAWIVEFAKHYDQIAVICLKEGAHSLPSNVHVYSLGKEKGPPHFKKLVYAIRFIRFAWRLRRTYQAVLVHMNQEYVLLMGIPWKFLRKRVYLWRNHYAGGFLTALSVWMSTKVFCTSRHSYTARFKKTTIMPVGTDADFSGPISYQNRTPRSILSMGRIAPSKRVHTIVDALGYLAAHNVPYTATIVGNADEGSEGYRAKLIERVQRLGISAVTMFTPAVPKQETHKQYRAHEIFVNASPSGMLDKTIFSAIGNGCLPLSSSLDLRDLLDDRFYFPEGNAKILAQKLTFLLALSQDEKFKIAETLRERIGKTHSLGELGKRIAEEII